MFVKVKQYLKVDEYKSFFEKYNPTPLEMHNGLSKVYDYTAFHQVYAHLGVSRIKRDNQRAMIRVFWVPKTNA